MPVQGVKQNSSPVHLDGSQVESSSSCGVIEKISEAAAHDDSGLHFSIKEDTSLPDLGGPGGDSIDCGDKLEDEAIANVRCQAALHVS